LLLPSPQERKFNNIENAFSFDLSKVERPEFDDLPSIERFSFVYPYFHFYYAHRFLGFTTPHCAAMKNLVSQLYDVYYPALLQNRARLVNEAKANNAYSVSGELVLDNDALNTSIEPYRVDLQRAYAQMSQSCRSGLR
jgi:hypothetical protein